MTAAEMIAGRRESLLVPAVAVGASGAGVVAAAMAGPAGTAGIVAAVARCVVAPTVVWTSESRRGGKTGERESDDDQLHSASPVCPIGSAPTRETHKSIVSCACRDANETTSEEFRAAL